MKFKDMIKNRIRDRFDIIMLVIIVLISILSLRLAIMTIAKGDYYRDISDNKIIKDIYRAPIRGEIKDVNGKLLAGNKPSFTVQMLKDEVNTLETKEKNDVFLNLISLLEEDGAAYVDDFPIQLNRFKYANEEDYENELHNPLDKVIDIIIENGLLKEVLNLYYVDESDQEHFHFSLINRALNALKDKNIELPILTELEDSILEIKFDEDKDVEAFKNKYGLDYWDTPIGSVYRLIEGDRVVIKKMVDHAISRKLVYDLLVSKGLEGQLLVEDYTTTFEEEYVSQKRELMKTFPEITKDSSAEDDFIDIFYSTSIKNFLEASFKKETRRKKEEFIFPGEILLNYFKKEKTKLDIETETSKEGEVTFKYTGKEDLKDRTPLDFLIEEIKDKEAFKKFMRDDQIRPLAQSQLLKDGINPRISIADGYEYVSIKNLKKFYSDNKIAEKSNSKEAFDYLKKKYEIDEGLSSYQVRGIFVMYNQLIKQGYLAYQPIYIAYGIKESTVAQIEESMMSVDGINISVESVRYYPEGETASHILGYLGKISQASEIKKYVEEKEYSPSSLIGKTGIEQSFEDDLKGKASIKKVEVDSVGNTTQTIEEEKSVPGDNIYLSIDLDLQKVAEESLEKTLEGLQRAGTYTSKWGNFQFGSNRSKGRPYKNATSGAVVAIDVKTGKVLASASYPSYDPNLFATGINTTDWQGLFPENEDDPLAPRPLYNIATQTAVQPGSTIKMLTALTALEKGLSPYKTIRDMGSVDIGNKSYNCLLWTSSGRTHGNENLYDALRDSCNYYFYTLAMGRNQKTGEDLGVKIEVEDIIDMSKKFGLNDKTGIEINIPAEASGTMPSPDRKLENTKSSLKSLLNREIEKTFAEGEKFNEEEKEELIEEILTWLEGSEDINYSETIKRLRALGIDPEAKIINSINREEPIADAIMFTYINFAKWAIQDTLGITIGEGAVAYTPIQMANYTAIIANGGYKHKLTLVDSIKSYNNMESVYEYKENSEKIKLNDYEHLKDLKKGMLKVTKEGVYRSIFNGFPIDVAAKTGTAKNESINPATKQSYDDFAWFVAFAPYEDPEIAIASVIFQGGSGGFAAPMTRDIIAQYLGLNEGEKED